MITLYLETISGARIVLSHLTDESVIVSEDSDIPQNADLIAELDNRILTCKPVRLDPGSYKAGSKISYKMV